MHIVIDCDPGIDDAVAIALALSRSALNVRVEAITVVDGNTSLSNALLNTAVALKYCGRTDIPVYRGSAKPLVGFDKVKYTPAFHIHGERGLGTYVPSGNELDEMQLVPNKSAPEALVELARKFSGTLHVIALGPLTNIALALRLDPEFPRHLASLFIMGGDYGAAFKRLGAEFNFFKDPEAANVVLQEAVGHCPVTMIPYDACFFSTQNCHWDWFDSVVSENTDFGKYFHNLYVPYRNNVKHFACCDGIAMAAFLIPGAIEAAEEFTPPCGVQLDYYTEPVKSETCPGGQRGCVILGSKLTDHKEENGNGVATAKNGAENGNNGESNGNGSTVTKPPQHRYNLRIATRINEHMFKSAIAEASSYYSQRSLPHYGY